MSLQTFQNHLKLEEMSDKTIYLYSLFYKLYHKNFERSLAAEDVKAFLAMYNHKLARSFLKKYAEYREYPLKIPKIKGRKKQKSRKALKYIEYTDYLRLLESTDYIQNKQLYLFLRLIFECGMRISEICGITKEAVNIDKGRIKVTAKGTTREVYIPEDINNKLFHYIVTKEPGKPIFQYTIRTWQRRLAAYSDVILGKKYNPHAFRHGCATYLHRKGMDLRTLQAFLGHKSLSTVEIYTHPTVEDVQRRWKRAMTDSHSEDNTIPSSVQDKSDKDSTEEDPHTA